MSTQTFTPADNDLRYSISMTSWREKELILYRLSIRDLALGVKSQIIFRFSQIKKLHQRIIDCNRMVKDVMPELPKTNSFCLWNRTNKDHRKIQQRRRQLEYYFDKIFNNPLLRRLNEIKALISLSNNNQNRNHSILPLLESQSSGKRSRSLPYAKKSLQYFI